MFYWETINKEYYGKVRLGSLNASVFFLVQNIYFKLIIRIICLNIKRLNRKQNSCITRIYMLYETHVYVSELMFCDNLRLSF